MKKILLTMMVGLLALASVKAQEATESGVLRLDEQRRSSNRTTLHIPDVNGYKVIKADFHLHTIFSDGQVLPSVRIMEAYSEGLDAMAFTEHVENHRYREDVKTNIERSFELSQDDAKRHGLTLIKGAEISRMTPPGHFNAIYVQDTKDYIRTREVGDFDTDKEAIRKAARQGAFIFWNHPGWKEKSIEGSYEWLPFIQDMVKEGAVQGIEVINGFSFHKKALDWCVDNNLAVLGTSDTHQTTQLQYDFSKDYIHRTMTLILAKSSRASDIREALDNRRTIAWAGKYLAGKEENLQALFSACVKLQPSHYFEETKKGTKIFYYVIKNESDLYFEIELEGAREGKVVLGPNHSTIISAKEGTTQIAATILNTYIRSDKNLQCNFSLN